MKWGEYMVRIAFIAWLGTLLMLVNQTVKVVQLPSCRGMYESKALIRIYQDSEMLEVAGLPRDALLEKAFVEGEIKIMRSQKNLLLVIEKLGLQKKWGRRLNRGIEMSTEQAEYLLRDRINIRSHQRNANAAEIVARSEISQEAADIANTIVDAYVRVKREEFKNNLAHYVQSLDGEIARRTEVLKEIQRELEKMRQRKTSNGSALQEMVKEQQSQQVVYYQMMLRRKQQDQNCTDYYDSVEVVARAEASDRPIP